MARTPHTATRVEVLNSSSAPGAPEPSSRYATADNGVMWEVLGSADDRTVYAISDRTGTVVTVTVTGDRLIRGQQVRVRIDFPRDTGDAAGTLVFDAGYVGGVAPRDLFN